MIAVCLKWVDLRPEVDPLTGAVRTDPRTYGVSAADLSALEWALRLGEAWSAPVVALSAGERAAEAGLREALAAGAASAVRVELRAGAPSSEVAAALASALPADVAVVLAGAWSPDRGSGSVPAFLAAEVGAAQALGLVSLVVEPGRARALRVERRLDRGRRELLSVPVPAVLSVEPGTARLRRSSLGRILASRGAPVEVAAPVAASRPGLADGDGRQGPYRPRPRRLPAPPPELAAGERIRLLSGALVSRTPPQRLALEPAAAADRLLEQLRAWGYV